MKYHRQISLLWCVFFSSTQVFAQQDGYSEYSSRTRPKPGRVCAFGTVSNIIFRFYNVSMSADLYLKWKAQNIDFSKNENTVCANTGYYGLSDEQKALISKRLLILNRCHDMLVQAFNAGRYAEATSYYFSTNQVFKSMNKIMDFGGLRGDWAIWSKETSKMVVDAVGQGLGAAKKSYNGIKIINIGGPSARELVKSMIEEKILDKAKDEIMEAVDPFEYVAKSVRQRADEEFKDVLEKMSRLNEC